MSYHPSQTTPATAHSGYLILSQIPASSLLGGAVQMTITPTSRPYLAILPYRLRLVAAHLVDDLHHYLRPPLVDGREAEGPKP